MEIIGKLVDCDGFTHVHMVGEKGKHYIELSNPSGKVVKTTEYRSPEEISRYMNMVEVLSNDVQRERQRHKVVPLTKKTFEVVPPPIPVKPVEPVKEAPKEMSLKELEQYITPFLKLIAPTTSIKPQDVPKEEFKPLPSGEFPIVQKPSISKCDVRKELADTRTVLYNVISQAQNAIKRIEKLEERLK